MRSIIQPNPYVCYLCGAQATECHHIFGGAMRKKSEARGLKVHLCHDCHNEPPKPGVHVGGVHFNKAKMEYLHRVGQRAAMKHYNWTVDEFRREFYKNYLEEDEC